MFHHLNPNNGNLHESQQRKNLFIVLYERLPEKKVNYLIYDKTVTVKKKKKKMPLYCLTWHRLWDFCMLQLNNSHYVMFGISNERKRTRKKKRKKLVEEVSKCADFIYINVSISIYMEQTVTHEYVEKDNLRNDLKYRCTT